jgi:hypothetical protein
MYYPELNRAGSHGTSGVGVVIVLSVHYVLLITCRLAEDDAVDTVTISPFWPCFWPSSFFFSHQVHALLKSLCKKTTKTSHNKIVLQNTTVAKHYQKTTRLAYPYG